MKKAAKKNPQKRRLCALSKRCESDPRRTPVLHFTAYAWAKLQWFCHYGDTEIGGFGITQANDFLLIEDFVTIKQEVTCVSVSFDDEFVSEFFEQQVDFGRRPEQFVRIWAHTV